MMIWHSSKKGGNSYSQWDTERRRRRSGKMMRTRDSFAHMILAKGAVRLTSAGMAPHSHTSCQPSDSDPTIRLFDGFHSLVHHFSSPATIPLFSSLSRARPKTCTANVMNQELPATLLNTCIPGSHWSSLWTGWRTAFCSWTITSSRWTSRGEWGSTTRSPQ